MLVALAFVGLKVEPERTPPALRALHRWLDSWTGIGAVERGMYRQSYDLPLTRYASSEGIPMKPARSSRT
jgi:hypothetical protein